MNVLFLCTANICRSPLAEAYMLVVARKLGPSRVTASSAGILDYNGHVADPVMVRLAARRSLDLSRHRARFVSTDMLRAADAIVAMERRHRAWVQENAAEFAPKVTLLRQHLDGPKDVADPTGGDDSAYLSTIDVVCRGVEKLAIALRYPR